MNWEEPLEAKILSRLKHNQSVLCVDFVNNAFERGDWSWWFEIKSYMIELGCGTCVTRLTTDSITLKVSFQISIRAIFSTLHKIFNKSPIRHHTIIPVTIVIHIGKSLCLCSIRWGGKFIFLAKRSTCCLKVEAQNTFWHEWADNYAWTKCSSVGPGTGSWCTIHVIIYFWLRFSFKSSVDSREVGWAVIEMEIDLNQIILAFFKNQFIRIL